MLGPTKQVVVWQIKSGLLLWMDQSALTKPSLESEFSRQSNRCWRSSWSFESWQEVSWGRSLYAQLLTQWPQGYPLTTQDLYLYLHLCLFPQLLCSHGLRVTARLSIDNKICLCCIQINILLSIGPERLVLLLALVTTDNQATTRLWYDNMRCFIATVIADCLTYHTCFIPPPQYWWRCKKNCKVWSPDKIWQFWHILHRI